ncbi:hypothetical protein GJ496_003613 [Pomphorhynchus laevis]|nr:hypothetical protein GJ496_003613 [Pomphorhynchus laevis]
MCSAIGGSKKVNSSSKMNEKTSDFGKKDDISKIGGVSSNNETAKKSLDDIGRPLLDKELGPCDDAKTRFFSNDEPVIIISNDSTDLSDRTSSVGVMPLHSVVPPACDDTISPSIKRLNLIEMPSSNSFDGDGPLKEWVIPSKPDKPQGKFVVATKKYSNESKSIRLKTTENAHFYWMSKRFATHASTEDHDLIVQFLVTFAQDIDCGGGYVKLFSSGTSQETLTI